MGLSKKHFIKIAEILNQQNNLMDNQEKQHLIAITNKLSDYFTTENNLFSKTRFQEAVFKGRFK